MDKAAILVMWHKPIVLTFIPPSHWGATWNLASFGLGISKKSENVEPVYLGRRSMNDLDLWYS